MLIPDSRIEILARCKELVSPFISRLIREDDGRKVISYGLSSFGYDCRLAPDEFFIFTQLGGMPVIDVKKFDSRNLYQVDAQSDGEDQYFILPSHSYALGMTVERFNLPANVTGIAYAKSTYARGSLIVNTTPLEAGWQGRLVIEFYNAAPMPIKLYAREGIIQVQFHESDQKCDTSYADRDGKYQDQTGMTLAKV